MRYAVPASDDNVGDCLRLLMILGADLGMLRILGRLADDVTQGKTMNKGELVEVLSKETGLTSAKAGEALNALIGIVTLVVTKGQTVQVTGFGSFSYTKRAARKGRNPATGEAIKIAASKSVRFSVGQTFKNTVNKKKA